MEVMYHTAKSKCLIAELQSLSFKLDQQRETCFF